MDRFEVCGRTFEDMADAAQEADFLHAEDGGIREVVALVAEPQQWEAGDVVYRSLVRRSLVRRRRG